MVPEARDHESIARGASPASNRAMNKIGKFLIPSVLLALAIAGCKSNQNQSQTPAADQSQQAATSQPAASDDPASANLAPASNTTETGADQNPPAPPADQSSQAAPAASDQSSASGELPPPPPDDGETAQAVAPQPPPTLPDYDQPEAPGPDYLWTPGYWAYAPLGYYWVPGAWVVAPYVGALWTPGYWGFYNSRYCWYHGYWGPHIGFYGGVNYGFGYVGVGYEGGYWRDNAFYYNTYVNHVNVNIIHNVYNYRVVNNYNTTRVAFVGGQGGLHYRPTPPQIVAMHEPHVPVLPAQRQLVHTAMQNHAQFASVNHGRPQLIAESRPINTGHPAPPPAYVHIAKGPAPEARPEQGHPAPEARPELGRPAAEARH